MRLLVVTVVAHLVLALEEGSRNRLFTDSTHAFTVFTFVVLLSRLLIRTSLAILVPQLKLVKVLLDLTYTAYLAETHLDNYMLWWVVFKPFSYPLCFRTLYRTIH